MPSSPTPAVLVTRGLTKHFGDRVVLDDVDLQLEPGEVFGYLGPNGAGKTTTMRLLLGALYPTSGTAHVFGIPSSDPTARRAVGHMPGDLHFDARDTTRDLVQLVARVRGQVDTARADTLIERFGLDPHRAMRELSTGNRRKVGIVLAFMHRPRLVLLDEPTSGLDPLLQQQFIDLVREEVADGVTVLLSSHVLPEVEVLADRVGILRAGRLVAVATVDELRQRAVQRLELTVEGEVDIAEFAALPGVLSADRMHGPEGTTAVDLVIQGGIDAVVKHAARHTVHSLTTHDDDLDEVFMAYYGA